MSVSASSSSENSDGIASNAACFDLFSVYELSRRSVPRSAYQTLQASASPGTTSFGISSSVAW
jgi:hypothetical protein